MPKLTFNPIISFDGVAVVIACITCSVWFGSLSATMRQHGESIKNIEMIQKTQSETIAALSQNLAVLTSLVNERTKK